MTKICIIAGFLGSGKTTLLKKILTEALADECVCVIENEFGEVNYDSIRLKNTATKIYSLSEGCVCCTLVSDLRTTIKEIKAQFKPSYIFIEASGVANLSDVVRAVERADTETTEHLFAITVADAQVCADLIDNFGDFYKNALCQADCIVLSRMELCSESEKNECLEKIKECNDGSHVFYGDWDFLSASQILQAAEGGAGNKKNNFSSMFSPVTKPKLSQSVLSLSSSYNMHEMVHVTIDNEISAEHLKKSLEELKNNSNLGEIYRIKGSVKCCDNYYIVDSTMSNISIMPTTDESESSICVIGKNLNHSEIKKYFL